MAKVRSGGGWRAILYSLKKSHQAGGVLKFYKALRSRNACKTCALGMGGQKGGMVNEAGHFPEVCKKSMQAMVADMQSGISPDFWRNYSVAQLQTLSPRELEHCGRLTQPLILKPGATHYQPIDWDNAMDHIAQSLGSIAPDETFWYFSGRSSNEAGFLLQLFARLYGTNNINNCSYYCHQASGVGLSSAIGTGAGTVQLEDVEKADLVFLIGANPASNHPRLMATLKNIRRNGGQVIVINPIIETGLVNFRVPSDPRSLLFGTKIATQYVQPHIGGDWALLYGIAKRVVELGAIDAPFLAGNCDGWPELARRLSEISWEEIVRKSGVERSQIEQVASTYAGAKNVIFSWTMGITHHVHGVQSVQSIVNLALMRGMIGRAGAGLLPIRGHSNVQGIGTMGVTPKLRDALFERLQNHFAVQLPTTPGLDTMASMQQADTGALKFGLCLGGNLYGSNPDATFAQRALGKLDTLVYLSTTLNTGHAHGLGKQTLILPMLARDEEPEATTQESMFSFVRFSEGGPARHVGPRSEVRTIAELAQRVLGNRTPIDWSAMASTQTIRQAIAKIVPGMQQLESIDQTKKEFAIPGRALVTPKFPTPTGRAKIFAHDSITELAGSKPGQEHLLRLMTLRSEGQFNTVVYEEEDVYRNVPRRDVILLHPDDLKQRNVQHGQRITVRSSAGQMNNVMAWSFEEIKPGNAAMYYPESNVLVPREIDPQSKTPAFKNVLISIAPTNAVSLPLIER